MYLSHYNIKENPFQISPDPKFLWLGETHKEALAILKYGIADNRGLLLLVGDVGTGKTTLINGLINELDENTIVATILDPGLDKLEFYNFLANAFQMNKKFDTKGDFLVHFIHFLHNAYARKKKVLLIIDEAQRLTHEMLEEIRLLSNIERQNENLINIFIVGQNELNENLAEPRNRALLQRITTNYNIDPLKTSEIADYIKFRLSVAGTEEKIFNSGAIREIISFSKCYPRLINIICDRALLTGFVQGKTKINAAIIKDCAKELQLLKETLKHTIKPGPISKISRGALKIVTGKPAWGIPIMIGIFCLLLAGAGYFYFQARSERQKVIEKKTEIASIKSQTSDLLKLIESVKAEKKHQPSLIKTDDQEVLKTQGQTQQAAVVKKKPIPFPTQKIIVNFPLNSNEISAETYRVLNRLVEAVSQHPGTEIIIKGYTDSRGSLSYNKQLSLFRANIVKNYFVGQKIPPSTVKTYGMGPENPIASNETPEGRSANRRVEIELKKTSLQ